MTGYQTIFYLCLIAATPIALALRWAVKRIKDSGRRELAVEIEGSFVYELGTNHLPHIYGALTKICEKLEIELPEPPPIRILPLERKRSK